jgi:POT family proton-dependent oligopeptide transporter
MAIGIIIMGFGFLFMVFAAMEFEKSGSSSMIWLVLAYFIPLENFVFRR